MYVLCQSLDNETYLCVDLFIAPPSDQKFKLQSVYLKEFLSKLPQIIWQKENKPRSGEIVCSWRFTLMTLTERTTLIDVGDLLFI